MRSIFALGYLNSLLRKRDIFSRGFRGELNNSLERFSLFSFKRELTMNTFLIKVPSQLPRVRWDETSQSIKANKANTSHKLVHVTTLLLLFGFDPTTSQHHKRNCLESTEKVKHEEATKKEETKMERRIAAIFLDSAGISFSSLGSLFPYHVPGCHFVNTVCQSVLGASHRPPTLLGSESFQ